MLPSSQIQFIFFDLDNTLWDYEANAKETLFEMFQKFELDIYFKNFDTFFKKFIRINEHLWHNYQLNKISKEELRLTRFKKVFHNKVIKENSFFEELSDYFITHCPTKSHLILGVKEVLETFSKKYKLGIITNGFEKTQKIKLQSSNISHFFDIVITSETIDCKKPVLKIFDYALQCSQFQKSQILMVGDNYKVDILGAKKAGWYTIWYNPKNKRINKQIQVNKMNELLSLL